MGSKLRCNKSLAILNLHLNKRDSYIIAIEVKPRYISSSGRQIYNCGCPPSAARTQKQGRISVYYKRQKSSMYMLLFLCN